MKNMPISFGLRGAGASGSLRGGMGEAQGRFEKEEWRDTCKSGNAVTVIQ
jgi:hypothetical protein